MSGRRTILLMVIAILSVLGLMAAASSWQLPKENWGMRIGEADGQTKQKLIGNAEDTIFFADSYDYITMYGNPQFWDDEKNMSVDLNQDGSYEEFAIASDRKEGILLSGMAYRFGSWDTMNFWSDNVFMLFRKVSAQSGRKAQTIKARDFLTGDIAELLWLLKEGSYIVKGSCVTEDDYVQISCCDIDEDGIKEILVSVGNKKDENVTVIYEYSQNAEKPFTYHGYIIGGTAVEYRGNNRFWAYNGSSGNRQYDVYLYENGRVKKLGNKG